MGYESRLYVVEETPCNERVIYSPIATFSMSCMGSGFRDIFTEKLRDTLYDENDNELAEDCYGQELVCAEIETVVSYIEDMMSRDPYRRLPPLYAFLTALDKDAWAHLLVIHYGY